MSNNVYEFRKKTKPLKTKRVNVYLRGVNKDTHEIYKDEEVDKMLRSRCTFFRFVRDSVKNRMELFLKEGTDLEVLDTFAKIQNNIVVTIESLNDKGIPCRQRHYLCVLDCFNFESDIEGEEKIIEPVLVLIVKTRLQEVDFVDIDKDTDTNEEPDNELS